MYLLRVDQLDVTLSSQDLNDCHKECSACNHSSSAGVAWDTDEINGGVLTCRNCTVCYEDQRSATGGDFGFFNVHPKHGIPPPLK